MTKLINETIENLYKELKLTVGFGTFKTDISDYFRECHEELRGASKSYFLWATPEFKAWVESCNLSVQDIVENIVKFVASTTMMLRLPQKTHHALAKAGIKYLDDLKGYAKDPTSLVNLTGLSLDLVNEVLKSFGEYLLTVG